MAKKRSLQVVNEHFEPFFNAVLASAAFLRQPLQALFPNSLLAGVVKLLQMNLLKNRRNQWTNRGSIFYESDFIN
ncbi:MAG: hypothetical protein ACPG5T_05555 [Endozoicomonas sp.]